MKFTVKKTAFVTALDKASATVSSKDTDPLLKTFNIEADKDGNEIRILSTDLSLGSIAKIRVAEISEAGAICVPASKFHSIIRSAEDGDIEFATEGDEKKLVLVRASRARWQVNALDAEDYPEVPVFDPEQAEEVSREKLLDVIQKVRYAASTEEVRASLMLIAFDGTRAAATDGSRLQVADFKGLESVQIPIFAVNNLVRLLNRSEIETIKVEKKKNHLLFQIGSDTFSTQRIYEEFPDVENIILKPAEDNSLELTLDKQSLLESVQRVRLAADEDRKQLDIVVQENNGGLPEEVELRAIDQNGELALETIPCTTTLAPGRTLCVNHEILVDALTMSAEKQVTLRLGEDKKNRRSPIYMREPGLKSVILQLRPEE